MSVDSRSPMLSQVSLFLLSKFKLQYTNFLKNQNSWLLKLLLKASIRLKMYIDNLLEILTDSIKNPSAAQSKQITQAVCHLF
jgi:hypothetical protein